MEDWQESYINTHALYLIKNTLCSTELLLALSSKGALGREDIEDIDAEPTKLKKAKLLYEVLRTRLKGFEILTTALYECGQTGAFLRLMNGMKTKNIKNPLKKCGIELDWKQLLENFQVTLRGNTFSPGFWFQDSTEGNTKHVLMQLIENNAYELMENYLTGTCKLQLSKESPLPDLPNYYIPRFISNRLKLNPVVFEQNINDIFVFRGLTRSELSKLVSKNTGSSSAQLRKLSANYMVLDNDEDFQDICSIAGNKPVHLILVETEGEEKEYILEESTGDSAALWKFVKEDERNQKCYLSENGFLDKIGNWEGNHKGFCICDSPGMGKTWLLKSLANKLADRYPDRIIVITSLVDILKHTKSTETILNTLVEHACPSNSAKNFVLAAMKSGNLRLELFLDALDEVPEEKLDFTRRLLKSIASSKASVRIFVASRRHLRSDLEKTLKVIAYDIRPLDDAGQVEFLVKYWLCVTDIEQTRNTLERLKEFGRAYQKQLQTSLSSESREIMGIPLQCYLLAEVTKLDATKYALRHNTTLETIIDSLNSVPKMYQSFVHMKLGTESLPVMRMAKDFHLCLALKEFSVDLGTMLCHALDVNPEIVPRPILSMGILECNASGNNPAILSFIHRTFAEYFLAELFSDVVTGTMLEEEENTQLKSSLLKFLASFTFSFKHDLGHKIFLRVEYQNYELLMNSYPVIFFPIAKNPVIVYFLDWRLRSFTANTFLNRPKEVMCALKTFNNCRTALKLSHILHFCAWKDCISIIRLLRTFLEHDKLTNSSFDADYKPDMTKNGGIYLSQFLPEYPASLPLIAMTIASAYASKEVISECNVLYKSLFDFDVGEEIAGLPEWFKTPLHLIVERGSYTLTEFFLRNICPNLSLKNRVLACYCFCNTVNETCSNAIKERIEIFRFLYDNETSILDEKYLDKVCSREGTLVYQNLHFEIIRFLLTETNANKLATTAALPWDQRQNPAASFKSRGFLHLVAESLSSDNFYGICRLLEQQFPETCFFQPRSIWVSPLHYVLRHALDLQKKTLETVPEVVWEEQINVKDEYGHGLLLSAVLGNCSLDIIKMMTDRGADINTKYANDRRIIHYSVASGNIEVTRFFLAQGQSLNQQNQLKETPLHCSIISFDMIKYCVRAGADISIQDRDGRTFVHLIVLGEICCVKDSPKQLQEVIELLFDVAKEKTIQILKTRFAGIPKSFDAPDAQLYQGLIHNYERTTASTLKLLLKTFRPTPEGLVLNGREMGKFVSDTTLNPSVKREREEIIQTLAEYGVALDSVDKFVTWAIHTNLSPDLFQYLLEKDWLKQEVIRRNPEMFSSGTRKAFQKKLKSLLLTQEGQMLLKK